MAPRSGRNVWLARLPSATTAARVFCIPYSGCGSSIFRSWPNERDGVQFLPVEIPGREARLAEPNAETFQDLAKAMIDGLEPCLDAPFAFFGHCWGALAAYEATAQLQGANGPRPAHLFVSSHEAPQDKSPGRMQDMDDAQLAEELATKIRALGGEPHPELLSIYVEALRADIEVHRRYVVPDPLRITCPVTAIGWTDDEEVAPSQMTGWSVCCDTTFRIFPGSHHRFTEAPPELLSTLCHSLGAQ
jgi:surfactin synthase thioesterase subunit